LPVIPGPLGELQGTWVGDGFNVLVAPSVAGDDAPVSLALTTTREAITFAAVTVPMFAHGDASDEGELPGVYFLSRANRADSGALVHAESGMWLNVPATATATAAGDAIVLRLSKSLQGDHVLAQGTRRLLDGAARIEPVSALPVELTSGRPVSRAAVAERYATVELPARMARQALPDPTALLRAALEAVTVLRSSVFSVSTSTELGPFAAEIDSSAFEGENPPGLTMDVTLWLHAVGGESESAASSFRLQFCWRSVRAIDGVGWPEVWVATLARR
jgi:hypothetical protein